MREREVTVSCLRGVKLSPVNDAGDDGKDPVTIPVPLLISPGDDRQPSRGVVWVNVTVSVSVEFKVTLHERVRYRGTLQY